jgi:tRNA pseudouridine55 synthase
MVAAAAPGPHGWIVLDKPVGIGSTTCVSVVKRVLRAAGYPKVKVGHGGTLDPLASGVLPIALGEATKLCGRMLDATKTYEFTVQFGRETDTLDTEGQVVATSDCQPGFGPLERVLENQFTGELKQLPPAYSAIKVDGRRAYDRARAGEDFDLRPREVTVFGWRYISEGFAGDWDKGEQYATLAMTVSKGTYIRSLARDIARALGTVGHVTMLRRTKAGPFTLHQAISLDFLEERAKARTLDGAVLPLAAGLDDIPALPVTPQDAQLLRHGQKLPGPPAQPGLYFATQDERPVALVEVSGDGLRVVRGFNL